MISQKRSDEETKEILKKMNKNKELVDEIKGMPQVKPDAKKTDGLISDDNFVDSCSNKVQQDLDIKKKVAENISLSVQKYKEEKEKEEKEEKKEEGVDNNRNIASPDSNNTVANYPLPEGTVIVHQFQENNEKKEQHYIIGRCLQQGGGGMTYIATYPGEKKGSKVVIKELYPFNKYRNINTKTIDWSWDKKGEVRRNYEQQFTNETNRIDELIVNDKGNINKLNLVIPKTNAFDWFGNKYYVMEFVNGNSLTNIMYSFENDKEALEKMPLFCRLKIMQQLCYAISNLHGIGCVHHDISPNNVMIDFDNDGNIQLKVIDYGLATNLNPSINESLSEFREGGTKCFTDTFYMDAEYMQADNEKQKLIDIYSLGAVLGWLCLLNINNIKSERFASEYEYMLRHPNTYFYQHEILEDDNNAVVALKLQLNLIIKLVHDATIQNLNTRIQTITDFTTRLNQIMEIDEDWVIKYNEYFNNNKKLDENLVDNSADEKDNGAEKTFENDIKINKSENDTKDKIKGESVILKPSGNKIKTLVLGLLIGIILSVCGYFVYEFINTDTEPPITEEIKYINNWLGSSYKTSIKELESQSEKLKECSSKSEWNKANQYLTEAKNIRDEIIGINLDKAKDKELDDIVAQTKIADKKFEEARIIFEKIKLDEQNQGSKKDPKTALVNEITDLFIKARTDKAARQELKNRMSNDSFIAEVEGEIHSYITSFYSFFSPVYDKYIIGKTHRVIDVVSDSKNPDKIRKVLIDKIN